MDTYVEETEEEFLKKDRERLKRVGRNRTILMGFLLLMLFVSIQEAFHLDIKWVSPILEVFSDPLNLLLLISIIVAIYTTFWNSSTPSPQLGEDLFYGMKGSYVRLVIFLAFHSLIGIVGAWFLYEYWYIPLGKHEFVGFILYTGGTLLMAASIWNSFDATTIKLNEAGQILYFGKSAFTNVKNGMVCLGLPKWMMTEIKVWNFKKRNVTIGIMKDGKREDFIIQGPGYDALFDVMFDYQPIDTNGVLKLDDSVEKRLVGEVNAAINRFVNANCKDSNGQKTEDKCYPTFSSLGSAILKLTDEILKETGEYSLRAKFALIGFSLCSLTIKDIANPNKAEIEAKNAFAAKAPGEAAEKLNVKNKVEKAEIIYDGLNRIGKVDEVPVEKRTSMSECMDRVERDEGLVRTNVIKNEGSGRSVVVLPPEGGK